jgi:hypothetical protein
MEKEEEDDFNLYIPRQQAGIQKTPGRVVASIPRI